MYYHLYSANVPYMEQMETGYVRVLHTVPNAPAVDIYANGKLIVKNLAYGDYTEYLTIPEGIYEVSLYIAGTKDSPIVSNMFTVEEDSINTIAAVGTPDNIEFLAIADSNEPIESRKAMIRFGHLSPDAPAVDITLPDGTEVFQDVSFKQVSSYVKASEPQYTLQVKVAGTPEVVLTVPDINVKPDKYYTIYAIGLAGQEPGLEAIILEDKSPKK